jgi:hypothetical protein
MLGICNTYSFSSETMVAQMCRGVTLYVHCLVWTESHVACMQAEFCWSCLYHVASWTALLCRLVLNDLIILWTPSLKYQIAGTWVWSLKRIFWVGSLPSCLLRILVLYYFILHRIFKYNIFLIITVLQYVKKQTAWIHTKFAVRT